jgi:signal recognition particle subunit SRP54
MRAVTGKPIKLIGVGERWDALEDFHPRRIAGRILGMGDVISLVEKAAENIDAEKAKAIAQKMRKGSFDLDDLGEQLKQMQRLGGMGGVMGMLPGMGKIKQQMASASLDDRVLKRQGAIISSMTPFERRNPKLLDARRKRRIASGSGTKVEDVNKLIKMHRQMADMMKMVGKNPGMMAKMAGALGMGGGLGGMGGPSPAEIEKMQAELARLDPKALEQLPKEIRDLVPAKGRPAGVPSAAPPPKSPGVLPGLGGGGFRLPGLPGLGGGKPTLPGLPGKKK